MNARERRRERRRLELLRRKRSEQGDSAAEQVVEPTPKGAGETAEESNLTSSPLPVAARAGESTFPNGFKDLRLLGRALRRRWNVSDKVKALSNERIERMLESDNLTAFTHLGAIKAAVMMDREDTRQDALESTQEQADQTAKVSLIRAALATPEGRKRYADLSASMCNTQTPPESTDPPPGKST